MFFCERRILHKCCAFILIAAKIKVAGDSRLKISRRFADYLLKPCLIAGPGIRRPLKKVAEGYMTELCESAALLFFF